MKHFGLKLVIALILTIGTLSGFLATKELDANNISLDSSLVEIFDSRYGAMWPQVVTVLETVARRHHVNIVRVDENFYDGDRLRDVYVMPSEAGSGQIEWVQNYLAPFARSSKLSLMVRPFSAEKVLDPRANYQVLGSNDAALDLASQFEELGLFGIQSPSHPLWFAVTNYALHSIELFSALLIGLSALTIGSVLLNVRGYAVWRLHGMTPLRIAYRDMRTLVKFSTLTLLLFMILSSGLLLWYNGWNQVYTFIRFSVFISVSIFVVQVIVYCIAVATVCSASIVSGLKGKIHLTAAAMMLHPLRIGTVLLAVPVLLGVCDSYTGLVNRNSALPYASGMEQLANITFPGYRTEKESDRVFEETGRWLRKLDTQGRIVVIKRGLLENGLPSSIPSGNTEIIYVNDTFLAKNPTFTQNDGRVGPTPEGAVNVVIPEHLTSHSKEILNMVSKGFAPAALPDGVVAPSIQYSVSVSGQSVFAYASRNSALDGPAMSRPVIHDPVIVALSNGSPLIFNESLAAWASYNGVVLFSDDIVSSIGRDLPKGSILGMIPLPGLFDDNYLAEIRELISNSTILGLSIVALFLATTTYYLLYARRSRSDIRAGHIAGCGFWRIHQSVLIRELIVVPLGVLLWICTENWSRARRIFEYVNANVPPPPSAPVPDWWRLIPAMSTSGVMMMLSVMLLYVMHRRMITTRTPFSIPVKKWINQ
ncbi:hypothetical protein [Pseudonocardia sp. ICBG1293]|uniref:hypothetical protein n=1 Tax=Pseudonocardia sp. ICBG1293 TaxID=2844382 RepID=UPI001CCD0CF5|nr:hypothetical protein [Pseudonocardia sp. ICBG1293]